MADFSSLQRRFDIQPARVITDPERNMANVPLTKYATIKASRALGKIPTVITIPANVLNVLPANIGQHQYRMLWQFNVTFPHYFVILTCNDLNSTLRGFVTVRFTLATQPRRYIIAGKYNNYISGTRTKIAPFLDYNSYPIFPNCCFEFWYTYDSSNSPATGIVSPLKIVTSLYVNPATADIPEIVVAPGNRLDIADLGFNLPENLPMQQANIRWLDN